MATDDLDAVLARLQAVEDELATSRSDCESVGSDLALAGEALECLVYLVNDLVDDTHVELSAEAEAAIDRASNLARLVRYR